MGTTPLMLRVDAEEISPDQFIAALNDFLGLAYDMERELAPSRERVLRWRLVHLGMGSWDAGIEAEPLEDAADIGPNVATAIMTGLPRIQAGERPDEFTDEMLERVRRMATLVGNGTRAIYVDAPTLPQTYAITAVTAARIEAVSAQGYTSIGTIEGTLEAISLHGRPTFTVYDAVTGRAVRCEFQPNMRKRVIAALGFKVAVHGKLRRDGVGRPNHVREVDTLHRLGTKPVTPIESLAGIFRGMGSTRDYLAEIRGE